LVSGALSCCAGLCISLTTLASASCQFTPEVLCRACAALPQLVLISATTVAVLFVFSHCEAVTCCRRLATMLSTIRKASPLVVGLTTAAIALRDPSSGNWLDSACSTDHDATYRLPTVLATVSFIACTTGAIAVLSTHMALRRPTTKMAEVLPVPLMELSATDKDVGAVRTQGTSGDVTAAQQGSSRDVTVAHRGTSGDVTAVLRGSSGDVTAVHQTCRLSCEAAAVTVRQEIDDTGSWRCSSKMTQHFIIIIIIILVSSKMGLPSMTSLLRSKTSLKSSQKSFVVKSKSRRTEDEEHHGQEDTCEVKMRRLFQRRRAAACRRHTVANIPAPDGSVPTERRSSEDASGQKSRDHMSVEPYQYQYVRQWSVDVAALADQLQNPKAHLSTSGVTLASRQHVCAARTDSNTGAVSLAAVVMRSICVCLSVLFVL